MNNTSLIRKFRNKFTGLNGILAQFEILHNKLAEIVISDGVSAEKLGNLHYKLYEINMLLEGIANDKLEALRSKLDEIATLLDGVTTTQFDILQSKLDSLIVSMTLTAASVEAKCHRSDDREDLEKQGGTISTSVVTPAQSNELVRIAFIVQHPSVWPSWRSVWSASCKDPRFVSKIVLTPFIHPFSSAAVTYDDLKQTMIDENVPFCSAEFFDVNLFKPHVTFIQNPYEDTRPLNFKLDQLKKAGTRIAYIPYGLEMGGGAWNISVQFDSLLHRSAWRIFARSERHKTMFGKYCQVGNDHVFVTGHPKFDSLYTSSCNRMPIELTNKIAGRKVLLYTPHFSVGEPPTWSTFKLYGEFIISELSRMQNLFLLIRPHPMFFQTMQLHKMWDTTAETNFRRMINESDNLMLDENPDYHEAFSVSDALMTDVGSFLLEYLPTGKPLLYLHHPNGLGMNDDGELVRFLYTASNTVEIAEFIEMIAIGKDPRKSAREEALPMFLFGLDSNVGERICQHIYSSINAKDSWSPEFYGLGSSEQACSESFWEKSTCTYLAPKDYYDRKESILESTLSKQPRFNKAIDMGCGDGRFTLILAKYADEVTGYDISPILVEKAKAAATLGNYRFLNQEIETIAPYEKYDLVSCMGVTSCIIDDIKFLRLLDKFRLLSKNSGSLLLIDTLSSEQEQIVSDQSGYFAKYRHTGDYLKLILRRGFRLREEILIAEDINKKLINKLFLFEFNDPSHFNKAFYCPLEKASNLLSGTHQ